MQANRAAVPLGVAAQDEQDRADVPACVFGLAPDQAGPPMIRPMRGRVRSGLGGHEAAMNVFRAGFGDVLESVAA